MCLLFVQKYQFKALTQWRILSMFHAFCPKEPDYHNLRCKTLCKMLIMIEIFRFKNMFGYKVVTKGRHHLHEFVRSNE